VGKMPVLFFYNCEPKFMTFWETKVDSFWTPDFWGGGTPKFYSNLLEWFTPYLLVMFCGVPFTGGVWSRIQHFQRSQVFCKKQ